MESIAHQLSRNASYLQPIHQNKDQVQDRWSLKAQESYADYAGMRRKSKRGNDGFYDGTIDFDTFRPQGRYSYMD